jgi:hypothetical protein
MDSPAQGNEGGGKGERAAAAAAKAAAAAVAAAAAAAAAASSVMLLLPASCCQRSRNCEKRKTRQIKMLTADVVRSRTVVPQNFASVVSGIRNTQKVRTTL